MKRFLGLSEWSSWCPTWTALTPAYPLSPRNNSILVCWGISHCLGQKALFHKPFFSEILVLIGSCSLCNCFGFNWELKCWLDFCSKLASKFLRCIKRGTQFLWRIPFLFVTGLGLESWRCWISDYFLWFGRTLSGWFDPRFWKKFIRLFP